jgi:hypothetical protein
MTAPSVLLRNAWGGLALATLALLATPAGAAPADPVEAAERAYEEVDFETQLAQATRALEQGQHDPATLANIYRLLGIAHAALNSPDAAKQAFMKLLAIDPDIALEQVLSPRLRTPYMEARGFWDVSRTRLAIAVAIDTASGALEIELSDPLRMGRRVRVMAGADAPHALADLAAAPRVVVRASALAPHAGQPLRVELLDRHANVILARALTPPLAPAPQRAASPAPSPVPGSPVPTRPVPRAEAASPTLSLVLGGGALLGLGIGVTAHVVRENKASEWNGTTCEHVGFGSRADQCGSVDDQRRAAQNVAFVGYAAGGVLLAASFVSYLLATNGEPEPEPAGSRLACGVSAQSWGVSCSTLW